MNPSKALMACAAVALLSVAGCHNDNTADPSPPADNGMPAANASAGIAGNASTAPAASTGVPDTGMASTPVGDNGGMAFEQMDQNHDGSVTPDEIPANDPLKQDFKQADSNGDGKLSADEVSQYRGSHGASGSPASPMASPGS